MNQSEKQNVLYIDQSSSHCGACGKECYPTEQAHLTMAGYTHHGKPGCGKPFTHISSHYMGESIKRAARQLRPDLPWHPRSYEREVTFDDTPDDRLRVVKMVPVDEGEDSW